MTTITITLPDDLYKQLVATSERENRPVDEIAIAGIAREVVPPESPPAPLARDEEMRLIREVMGDRIWSEDDVEAFFNALNLTPMSDKEAERIVAAIPPLHPPLSQTVIQMRDEERY